MIKVMDIWGWLFEINDVVSKRFVKISKVNKLQIGCIFCWKNVRIFCIADCWGEMIERVVHIMQG